MAPHRTNAPCSLIKGCASSRGYSLCLGDSVGMRGRLLALVLALPGSACDLCNTIADATGQICPFISGKPQWCEGDRQSLPGRVEPYSVASLEMRLRAFCLLARACGLLGLGASYLLWDIPVMGLRRTTNQHMHCNPVCFFGSPAAVRRYGNVLASVSQEP